MAKQLIEARFSVFTKSDNYVAGVVGKYKFTAKLFDEPSKYGIKNGRVSKFDMRNVFTGEIEVNYDRGWDIKASVSVRPYYKAAMELLENSPKRWA